MDIEMTKLLMIILVACQLALAGCQGLADASSAQPLRRPSGIVVPLQQRVGQPKWRRHLLRSGSMRVRGGVRELGYFYANLVIGTPARSFSVIIDTGSTITYVPCKGCAKCGHHQAEWFDPDTSTTARRLGCGESLCNCGSPGCSCNNNFCYYRRFYAEGSSSEGWLIQEAFSFPDPQQPVNMVFGCENGESGEIFRQMADGIMGMGNNHNAFQSQLVAQGIIEDVFSLCFGFPRDGVLLLGDVALPSGSQTVFTPLLTSLHLHFYNVKMEGITVGGEPMPLDPAMFDFGYGVVLDSGTTFTYLPTVAFTSMSKAVGDWAAAHGLERTPGADPQYNDICWKGAPEDFTGLEAFFPPVEFIFGGGARLSLPPLRYLFLSKPGEYCLNVFDNGASGTLIGSGSMLDVVVTYDRRNGRVGFTSMPCADVAAATSAVSAVPTVTEVLTNVSMSSSSSDSPRPPPLHPPLRPSLPSPPPPMHAHRHSKLAPRRMQSRRQKA